MFPPVANGLGSVLAPGPATHSVDGDDGEIDGSGSRGFSLRSTHFNDKVLDGNIYANLLFRFQPINGQYPTAFGFVWTDGEASSYVSLILHEVNSNTSQELPFPAAVGDPNGGDRTADDRFFGVTSGVGIDRVSISSYYVAIGNGADAFRRKFFEIDHLQFGYKRVPEPSGLLLWSTCLGILERLQILWGCRVRRRCKEKHNDQKKTSDGVPGAALDAQCHGR